MAMRFVALAEMSMTKLDELKIQYVTDELGQKVSVLLPVQQFNELMEDIEDLAAVAERREEPTLTHEQVLAELKRDGLLHD
jgi:hypothetical protein